MPFPTIISRQHILIWHTFVSSVFVPFQIIKINKKLAVNKMSNIFFTFMCYKSLGFIRY